jgi:hypothetical protein
VFFVVAAVTTLIAHIGKEEYVMHW